ncbi:MAG: glycosyltransferase family 4 protein [Bacteroidota bacterium]
MATRVDVVLSCAAKPFQRGGLSQHLAQLITAERAAGHSVRYFASAVPDGDAEGHAVAVPYERALYRYTPLRFNRRLRDYVGGDLFDRGVARAMPPTERFVGFVGKALRSMQAAKAHGAETHLHAANSHVDNLRARHAEAHARYGFDHSWLGEAQRKKTLREYAEADVIWVASDYSWRSFTERGFPASKLRRVVLETDPRYQPPTERLDDGVFRVTYCGSVNVGKGVPLLIEAFRALPVERAELILIGGPATRGMRQYLDQQIAADPRIRLAPGDPLPHLHRADAHVHPTYEDGWAYAPAEALACGVPTIVTEDTGMAEIVRDGENGYVVPTGSVDALVDRLQNLHTSPLAATHRLDQEIEEDAR